jgi:hypothetical protein
MKRKQTKMAILMRIGTLLTGIGMRMKVYDLW